MFFDKFRLSPYFFYQSNNDGGEGSGEGDPAADQDFETYLDTLPDDIKGKAKPLFTAHITKLSNAVKTTRTERDDLSKQLKKMAKDLEDGSEAKKTVDKLTADLDAANSRADFLEEAPSKNCRNPKVAYAVVKANNLYDSRGNVDWKALQTEAPELFGEPKKKVVAKRTAGNGTDGEPPKNSSMNEYIRRKAGYNEITQEA